MPEEVLIIIQVHKRGNLLALANANPNIIEKIHAHTHTLFLPYETHKNRMTGGAM